MSLFIVYFHINAFFWFLVFILIAFRYKGVSFGGWSQMAAMIIILINYGQENGKISLWPPVEQFQNYIRVDSF